MRIIKMTYSKLFSLGNFQNEKIELEAEIDRHDDLNDSMYELHENVEKLFRQNRLREEALKKQTETKTPSNADDDLPF